MFFPFLLVSCSEEANAQLWEVFGLTKKNKEATDTISLSKNEEKKLFTVGQKILGDFNGDGKKEFAYLVKVKEGYGNPVIDDDSEPDQWEVQFSDKTIKPISVGCCGGTLIAEGDLNNDKIDEITVYNAPINGCMGVLETYTIKTGNWKPLFESFTMYYCSELTDEELGKLVELENGSVYYHTYDVNDGELLTKEGDKIRFERLIKHKAKLL